MGTYKRGILIYRKNVSASFVALGAIATNNPVVLENLKQLRDEKQMK